MIIRLGRGPDDQISPEEREMLDEIRGYMDMLEKAFTAPEWSSTVEIGDDEEPDRVLISRRDDGIMQVALYIALDEIKEMADEDVDWVTEIKDALAMSAEDIEAASAQCETEGAPA